MPGTSASSGAAVSHTYTNVGSPASTPVGITNSGLVVGFVSESKLDACLRPPTAHGGARGRPLPVLGGGDSRATGANDAGVIVGATDFGQPAMYKNRPMLWAYIIERSSGSVTDFRSVVAQPRSSFAVGVTNAGEVVGFHFDNGRAIDSTDDRYPVAFVYHDRVVRPLLPGEPTFAIDVSPGGWALVGISDPVQHDSNFAVVSVKTGATRRLPHPSSIGYPWAVNDSGTVVGETWQRPGGQSHAWIDPPIGGSSDLNDLIPSHPDWTLESATGINARGHVVGTARLAGEPRCFLLAPKGEIRETPRFERVIVDQIIFGIAGDGGGRLLRHGPVPPMGPREIRERFRAR